MLQLRNLLVGFLNRLLLPLSQQERQRIHQASHCRNVTNCTQTRTGDFFFCALTGARFSWSWTMPPSKSKSSSSDSLSTTFGFAAAFFFTILAPKSPSCSQNWCIMSVLQKMRLKFARTISLSFGISPRRFAIGMNLKIETVKATGQKKQSQSSEEQGTIQSGL